VIPTLGDALEFPAGAFRRTNQNNFPVGMVFDSIRFSGNDEYSLTGSAVVLLGGISATNSAQNQHTINGMNMSLGGEVEFSCDANSVLNIFNSTIALNGQDLIVESDNPTGGPHLNSSPISGSGRVITRGTGRSRLFGSNTYPGDTLVESGTLDVGSFNGGGAPIRGNITVGAAGLPAILLQTGINGLSSASTVTVGAQGQWNVQPGVLSQSVATVDVLGGTVSHGTVTMVVGSLSMVGGQINGSGPINVSASLEAGGAGQAVISSPLTLSNNTGAGVEVRVEPNSSLLLSGAISGDANGTFFRKLGPGKAILSAIGTTLPRMDIEEGTVQFDGQAPSTTAFLKGGEISGIGRVGNVSSSAGGGTANPGQNSGIINSPGALSTGNVSWNANTTFRVGIGGVGPSISHDQITATGTIALGSAVLALDVSTGLSPSDGQSLILINNDSTDPVTQTFTGLAEGGTIPATGGDFLISYSGGDGNDVVLVWNANAPPAPPTLGNIVITPAGPASPARFAAIISGGPANGTLLLKGSPDLQSPITTWETLATIPLNGSGSATVDVTASSSSIGASRYFFSLLAP
jgi:autotransporter-associated beta strand protein